MSDESFDISTIQVADTFDIVLKHPATDEPLLVGGTKVVDEATGDTTTVGGTPMSVTVNGPGTRVYKAAQSAQSNRITKRMGRRGGKIESTPEEDAADKAAFLSACTVSFNNFNYKGLPNERETFRALYLDPKSGWIADQVNKEMGDWANFTQAAPSS